MARHIIHFAAFSWSMAAGGEEGERASEGTKQARLAHARTRASERTTGQGERTFFRWKGIALLRLCLLQLASVELSNVVKHLSLVSHGVSSLVCWDVPQMQNRTSPTVVWPVQRFCRALTFCNPTLRRSTMEKTVPPAGVRDR